MKRWVIAGLIFMLFLSGCKKKVELTEKETVWENMEHSQHITEQINENLVIDADVVINTGFEKGKADLYVISEKQIDRKHALDVFSKGKTIESEKINKYGGEEEDEEEEIIEEVYQFDNGDEFTLLDNWMYYSNPLSEHLTYCIRFSEGQQGYNKEKFMACKDDFEFMTLNQANEQCLQLLNDLGISVDKKNGEKIRLPHELLKEEEDVIVMEGIPEEENPKPKDHWGKEDDCYYFEYTPLIGDYALLTDISVPDTERIRVISRIQMQYNKNGIVLFAGGEQFQIEKTLKKQVSLMNLNAALEKLKARFKNVILKEKITVTGISMGNLCMNTEDLKKYETLPVWKFYVKQEDESTNTVTYWDIVFDATSGKEIY